MEVVLKEEGKIRQQGEFMGQEEPGQMEGDIHTDVEEEISLREFEYQKRIAELEEEVEKLKQYKELLAKGLKEHQAAVALVLIRAIKSCMMFPSLVVNSLMADIPLEVREAVRERIIREVP